jgi:hypothetical protein
MGFMCFVPLSEKRSMKVHKISKDDALALSARSEDHFFDRKGLSTTGKQLQKLVVAFANADGGSCLGHCR